MHRYAVLIGRFQPFHNGHLELVRNALKIAKELIIVLGSSGSTLTPKNPFTNSERKRMVENSVTEDELRRIAFVYVQDHLYDDRAWVSGVRQAVEQYTTDHDDIVLVGHNKDATSGYLAHFPDWAPVLLPIHCDGIAATHIRKAIFEGDDTFIEKNAPEGTRRFLTAFYQSERYAALKVEYDALEAYKESWAGSPYPPIFVTVDSVISFADYVLLVKRGQAPGKGLWAIPGGFVNQDETLQQASLRELKEETSLALGLAHLQLKSHSVFDHPQRSLRGRTITHAFHYEADSIGTIAAGDDAAEAKWFPIHKLGSIRNQMHDDHFFILEHFLGAIK